MHLPAERRWGLGVAAFELGGGYARQEPLARLGRPLLAELVDRAGESAHLAVMTGRDVLYIVEERAPRRPALVTDVGVRLPAHLTATGPVDARGAAPRAGARAVSGCRGLRRPHRPRSRVAPASCARCSARCAPRGYALEDGEVTLGLGSVGVAVLDHVGWPIAAIAVTYASDDAKDADALAALVQPIANELGRRIRGARPAAPRYPAKCARIRAATSASRGIRLELLEAEPEQQRVGRRRGAVERALGVVALEVARCCGAGRRRAQHRPRGRLGLEGPSSVARDPVDHQLRVVDHQADLAGERVGDVADDDLDLAGRRTRQVERHRDPAARGCR